MESILENKYLLYSLLGTMGAIFALALGIVPKISSTFEIVDFPNDVSCFPQILTQFQLRTEKTSY